MKILLDDHHGIGDVAMFISVLHTVKMKYPDAEIHMLIKSKVEQNLIEAVGGVTAFYYYDPLNHSAGSIARLILALRKNHYDLGICHIGTNPKFGSLLMKAIGCKKSIGSTSGKRIINYTVPVDTSPQPRRARKNALLAQKISGGNVKEKGLLANIEFEGKISKKINDQFAGCKKIAICVGTGSTVIGGVSVNAKQWPDDHWLALIDKLIEAGYKIVLLGGNKERKERDKAFEQLPDDAVMDLVGEIKLSESLEAIQSCDLLVAGDTGMGFCSALMNKPTLSLLGPSGPDLAAPYGENAEYIFLNVDCSPCYGTEEMRDCKDRKCMRLISADMVFGKCVSMLQNSSRTGQES